MAANLRAGLARTFASRRFLLVVLAAAFAVRVSWTLAAGDARRFSDSDSYIEIADNLAAGHGFIWGDPAITGLWQRAGRPPLYPILVAATRFDLFGREFLALYLVQAILATATVALFALAAKRLIGGVAAGMTALLVAFDPFLVFSTGTVLTETLFAFFLAALLFGVATILGNEVRGPRRRLPEHDEAGAAATPGPQAPPSSRRLVAATLIAGLAAGASLLTRPSLLGLVAVFAALVAMWARPRTRAILSAAAILALAFLVVLPWGARNRRVTGHWVFTTLGVGASLYDGLGAQADGSSNMAFMHSMPQLARRNEYDRDRYLTYRALKAACEDPPRVARLALVKIARFWSPAPNSTRFAGPAYLAASLIFTLPVYALAIFSLAVKAASKRTLTVLAAGPVYFTLVHSVFVASARYRTPIMPLVAMLAAAGAAWLLSRGSSAAPGEAARK